MMLLLCNHHRLYTDDVYHTDAHEGYGWRSPIDVDKVDLISYPRVATVPYYKVVLNPGDCVVSLFFCNPWPIKLSPLLCSLCQRVGNIKFGHLVGMSQLMLGSGQEARTRASKKFRRVPGPSFLLLILLGVIPPVLCIEIFI